MSNFQFWKISDNQDFESVLLLSGFLIKKYLYAAPTAPMGGGGIGGMGTGGYPLSGIVHSYIVPNMATEPDNNALNIQQRSYTNGAGKNVLEYVTADTIVLDLPFVMTSPDGFWKYL
jgi:hypothetical protein